MEETISEFQRQKLEDVKVGNRKTHMQARVHAPEITVLKFSVVCSYAWYTVIAGSCHAPKACCDTED